MSLRPARAAAFLLVGLALLPAWQAMGASGEGTSGAPPEQGGAAAPSARAPAVSPMLVPPYATPSTWPSWRGDAGQTGRSTSPLALPLVEAWSHRFGDAVVAAPVVDGLSVVVGSKDGTIAALSRETGAVRWAVTTDGPVEAPALIAGGLAVVGSRDGTLRAIDVATGALRWAVALQAELTGAAAWTPPRADRGPGVLIGAYDGRLHHLDLATGASRWVYATGSYLYGSAALGRDASGEVAVIGGCDGAIHVVGLDDGVGRRKVPVDAYVGASVLVHDGAGYVGHFGHRVVRFDPATAAIAWTYLDRSFPYLSSPALAGEVIAVGGRDKVVRGLHLGTGEAWWYLPTSGKVDASPVVVGDKLLVGAADGRFHVASVEDGSVLQTLDLGAAIQSSAAVASGWVWVGTDDGRLVAMRSTPAAAQGPAPAGKKGKRP